MAAVVAAMAFCSLPLAAQDSGEDDVARPVDAMFSLDVGQARVKDTYLTPITYSGTHLRLEYSAMQATGFSPEKWVRHLEVGAEYDNVENLAHNNTMHSVMAGGHWSLMRRWRLDRGLQLMAGGMVTARGGAIYNGSNSNNICSVKVHAGVGVAGAAVLPVHMGRLPVTLSWQVNIPVVGAFYSPDYDESYYEIYVGNHSGLVHPAWWGNRFEANSMLGADLHLGNTILRVGYRLHQESSHINNLDTRLSSHSFVLGLGGEFLNVGRRGTPSRTVSAMY